MAASYTVLTANGKEYRREKLIRAFYAAGWLLTHGHREVKIRNDQTGEIMMVLR